MATSCHEAWFGSLALSVPAHPSSAAPRILGSARITLMKSQVVFSFEPFLSFYSSYLLQHSILSSHHVSSTYALSRYLPIYLYRNSTGSRKDPEWAVILFECELGSHSHLRLEYVLRLDASNVALYLVLVSTQPTELLVMWCCKTV